MKQTIEEKRSAVRRWVTYIATFYIFGGSAALIAALWIDDLNVEKLKIAKEVFYTVLPVATGVITYWFASRKPLEKPANKDGQQQQNRGGEQPRQGSEQIIHTEEDSTTTPK